MTVLFQCLRPTGDQTWRCCGLLFRQGWILSIIFYTGPAWRSVWLILIRTRCLWVKIVNCQYYLHVSSFHSGRRFHHSLWVSVPMSSFVFHFLCWDALARAQHGGGCCGAISWFELLCQIGHFFIFLVIYRRKVANRLIDTKATTIPVSRMTMAMFW